MICQSLQPMRLACIYLKLIEVPFGKLLFFVLYVLLGFGVWRLWRLVSCCVWRLWIFLTVWFRLVLVVCDLLRVLAIKKIGFGILVRVCVLSVFLIVYLVYSLL